MLEWLAYRQPIITQSQSNPQLKPKKTRCGIGASILPPAVILSITNDPESDDVTKNTKIRITEINDKILPNGNASYIWNIASGTSVIPFAPSVPI